MNQQNQEGPQCYWVNIFEDQSEAYPNERQAFSKFYQVECKNELLKQISLTDQSSSQENIVESGEYQSHIHHQLSKTQIEEPVHETETFLEEGQPKEKKKGSSNCQNSPKLMAKVLYQLYLKFSSEHSFSDQARYYAKYEMERLKKNPTINSLRQVFVQTSPELIDLRKKAANRANSQNLGFSLAEQDIKQYQQELRRFVIQRRQVCMQMATKREIKDRERLLNFIKYVQAFIENLERGIVKGKLKKF